MLMTQLGTDELDDDQLTADNVGRLAAKHLARQIEVLPTPSSESTTTDAMRFGITRANLKSLAAVTNLRPGDESLPVTLQVRRDSLLAAVTYRGVTAVGAAPIKLQGPAGEGTAFQIEHMKLVKLGSDHFRAEFNFEVDVTKTLLAIEEAGRPRRSRLELTIHPAAAELTDKLREHPTSMISLPLRDVLAVLRIIKRAADARAPEPGFELIQFCDGQVCGGSSAELIVCDVPSLKGVDLRLHVEDLAAAYRALSRMGAPQYFVDTAETQFIRESAVQSMIKRPSARFPDVSGILAVTPTTSFRLSLAKLLTDLPALSIAASRRGRNQVATVADSTDPKFPSHVLIDTRSQVGHVSTYFEPSSRCDVGAIIADSKISIPLRSLLRLIRFSSNMEWVDFSIFRNKTVMITQDDGTIRSRTFIAARRD